MRVRGDGVGAGGGAAPLRVARGLYQSPYAAGGVPADEAGHARACARGRMSLRAAHHASVAQTCGCGGWALDVLGVHEPKT